MAAPAAHMNVPSAPHTASYQIDARLDPVTKTLHGTAQITYRNTSSDTLSEVWFRLYLRAFRDHDTFWMQEYTDAATLTDAHRGDITLEQLSLSDGTDLLPTTTMTETLLQVPLPTALAPDQTVTFDVAWVTTLPRVFYLTGYGGRDDTFFMLGQWYPHLVVYHQGSWDTEPWHAETSFFHDFAQYVVELTVPEDYLVASTGVPVGETITEAGMSTTRYTADQVTNFAFAASPDFQLASTQVGDTEILLYHMPDRAAYVTEYLDVARESMTAYNDWYEPYPHPRLTMVDVPDGADAAASMEYPMLFTVHPRGAPPDSGGVAFIVSHEMAHQWWPMQVSTNEAREPWLDEGVVTYSGIRYLAEAQRTVVGDEVIPYSQSWYSDISKAIAGDILRQCLMEGLSSYKMF